MTNRDWNSLTHVQKLRLKTALKKADLNEQQWQWFLKEFLSGMYGESFFDGTDDKYFDEEAIVGHLTNLMAQFKR